MRIEIKKGGFKMSRQSIDIFYMKMAYLVSERATCIRRKVGSVIVRNKIVLGTGYNEK